MKLRSCIVKRGKGVGVRVLFIASHFHVLIDSIETVRNRIVRFVHQKVTLRNSQENVNRLAGPFNHPRSSFEVDKSQHPRHPSLFCFKPRFPLVFPRITYVTKKREKEEEHQPTIET